MAKDKGQDPDAMHVAEPVEVDVVRPMRLRYLRPGQPADSVVYQSDALDSARHFCVRDADCVVVGVGSVHQENRVAGHAPHGVPGFRVRGMAVDAVRRGQGVGRSILAALMESAVAADAAEVWANARVDSIGIYEKSGFTRLSSEFDIPTIGLHVVAAKTLRAPKKK